MLQAVYSVPYSDPPVHLLAGGDMQYGFLGHGLAVPPDVGVLRLGVAVLGGDLPRAVGVVGVAVDGRGVQVGLPAGGLDVRGPGEKVATRRPESDAP